MRNVNNSYGYIIISRELKTNILDDKVNINLWRCVSLHSHCIISFPFLIKIILHIIDMLT
jgi:hypothetical protein